MSRSRRLFWYRIQIEDTTMPDATMSTMMVARALTSGLTPEPDLGEDDHGQRARAGSRHELRNHQVIPRQCERQQPARHQRRHDQRQRDPEKHFGGTRPEIHGSLFERLVKPDQPRLYHHRHVGHAEGDVRERDRDRAAALGPANRLLQRNEQQQQRQAR